MRQIRSVHGKQENL